MVFMFIELLGRDPSIDLHLLAPMLVVEELDGRKLQGNTLWRASHSLAYLDKTLPSPTGRGVLRTPSSERSGKVIVEFLFDPPGHTRLPVNDDEIIDRLRGA